MASYNYSDHRRRIAPETWAEIGDKYSAGIRAADLEEEYGIPRATIYMKMGRLGIRAGDVLKGAIVNRTKDLLVKKENVAPIVPKTAQEAIVEHVAKKAKAVVTEHRLDTEKARQIYGKLLKDINLAINDSDAAEELGLGSVAAKANALSQIAQSMERIIKLERQAWSLDENESKNDNALADFIKMSQTNPANSLRTIIQMRKIGDVKFEMDKERD